MSIGRREGGGGERGTVAVGDEGKKGGRRERENPTLRKRTEKARKTCKAANWREKVPSLMFYLLGSFICS